jgi:AraC family transcriptional regulator
MTNSQIECANLPILSSRDRGWESLLVEQFQYPAGEGRLYYPNDHAICLSLAPRPVPMLQTQGNHTHTGLYAKGDFSIMPAQMPVFARWESDDCFVQIRIASRLLQQVAGETLVGKSDALELLPEFKQRDPQLEAIALLLLHELQQQEFSSSLYIESLSNVLAVHLLRQYVATKPNLPIYEGGLPQRQLLQVLDYIQECLHQDIKLADLASLLDMSPFHFSHLFKQSIGTSPHQYLLQQRIERTKQLLKQTDQSIMDIALLCGFNSHSHLSKQFRQQTGITPSAYRANQTTTRSSFVKAHIDQMAQDFV